MLVTLALVPLSFPAAQSIKSPKTKYKVLIVLWLQGMVLDGLEWF